MFLSSRVRSFLPQRLRIDVLGPFGDARMAGGVEASLAALERAIKSSSCPWFGVDLDPVAILRDVWPMDDIFSRIGGLIRHVRGRDAVRGADRRTRPAPIGKGSVNWGELLANTNEAGYHGWLTIDSLELQDRAAAAQAGLDYLRKL